MNALDLNGAVYTATTITSSQVVVVSSSDLVGVTILRAWIGTHGARSAVPTYRTWYVGMYVHTMSIIREIEDWCPA
jgi:uracil phosphoribosyltransferase